VHHFSTAASTDYTTIMNLRGSDGYAVVRDINAPPEVNAAVVLSCLRNKRGVTEDDVSKLRSLSEADLCTLVGYVDALEKQWDSDEFKALNAESYDALYAQLEQAMAQMADAGELHSFPENIRNVENAAPAKPPVLHALYKSEAFDAETYIDTFNRDETIDHTPFPCTPMYDDLTKLLLAHRDAAAEGPITLQVSIYGGDDTFSDFLYSYMLLHQVCIYVYVCVLSRLLYLFSFFIPTDPTQEVSYSGVYSGNSGPTLLHNITLKIFVVPVAQSSVGNMLARFDSWYHRHIYIPFRSDTYLLPWLASDHDHADAKESKAMHSENTSLPGVYLRGLLNEYFEHSRSSIDVCVCLVEGWKDQNLSVDLLDNKNLPDVTLPFVNVVSVGVRAAAQDFLMRRKMPIQTPLEELLKNKNFSYTPKETGMCLSVRVV
jgi:hypothetical protein